MRRTTFGLGLAAATALSAAAPSPAFALSAGCSAADAGGLNFTSIAAMTTVNQTFEAGEVVTIVATPAVNSNVIVDLNGGNVFTNALVTAGASVTVTVNIITSGANAILLTAAGGATVFTFTCGVGGADAASVTAVGAARAALTGSANLVSARIRAALPGGDGFPRRPAPDAAGAAGQGLADPISVWANVGWSGFDDDTNGADLELKTVTGVVGADGFVQSNLLVGGALSVSRAESDTDDSRFAMTETGVLAVAYGAYAIDEHFALDGSVAYGVGFGDVERNDGAVDGRTVSHRYYLSANASAREYWGDFGLLGTLGVFWGQSFQGAYVQSDDTRIGSERVRLGSVGVRVQPSYRFQLDGDVELEPFVNVGYGYDFTQSKISGAANDPDQVDVGAGFSVAADGLRGVLEAKTALGREDQRRTSVNGSLRVDF